MTRIGELFEQEKQDAINLADAKRIVSMINSFANNYHISVEEACAAAQIGEENYANAKSLVQHSELAFA